MITEKVLWGYYKLPSMLYTDVVRAYPEYSISGKRKADIKLVVTYQTDESLENTTVFYLHKN